MSDTISFDEWIPRDYLRDFYSDLQEDETHAIRYFVEQMRQAAPGPVLCFGCGPTLHHVFLAVPHMTELVLADYLPGNLEEIERWRDRASGAHDWTPFVRYTLLCEAGVEPSAEQISVRTEALRRGITRLMQADAGLQDPLGVDFRGRFATVLHPFCADSATDDKATWRRYSHNVASLVRPGGLILTSALQHCRRYKIGQRHFPAADVDEPDLRGILEHDFRPDSVQVEVREVPEHRDQGYTGILLSRALKI